MAWIGHKLDLLFEDATRPLDAGPYETAIEIAKQLDEVQQKVVDLQTQLSHATDRLNGDLAIGVRRKKPGLNVALDKHGCKVGYRSKHLAFSPDLKGGLWMVKSPDDRFMKTFIKLHAPRLAMSSDMAGLVNAIADFFTNHYKTLGEDIQGTGVLLIDGKSASIFDLAQKRSAPLRTRKYSTCNTGFPACSLQ